MTARTLAIALLGRDLTPGELHLDLVAAEQTLETGKTRLHIAILAEQFRVARVLARGGTDLMRISPAMLRTLERLRRAGADQAKAEIRSMGIAPAIPPPGGTGRITIEYDELDRYQTLEAIRAGLGTILQAGLDRLTVRTSGTQTSVDLAGLSFDAVARALVKEAPGALDLASRLVTGPYTSGLAGIYETNAELFPAWQYSAVLDGAACDECRRHDGMVFDSLTAAYRFLPNFGPNPYCYGDGRCRCRLVPAPPDRIPAGRSLA